MYFLDVLNFIMLLEPILLVLNWIDNFKLGFWSLDFVEEMVGVVIERWCFHSNLNFTNALIVKDGIDGDILKTLKLFLNSYNGKVFQLVQMIIHFKHLFWVLLVHNNGSSNQICNSIESFPFLVIHNLLVFVQNKSTPCPNQYNPIYLYSDLCSRGLNIKVKFQIKRTNEEGQYDVEKNLKQN